MERQTAETDEKLIELSEKEKINKWESIKEKREKIHSFLTYLVMYDLFSASLQDGVNACIICYLFTDLNSGESATKTLDTNYNAILLNSSYGNWEYFEWLLRIKLVICILFMIYKLFNALSVDCKCFNCKYDKITYYQKKVKPSGYIDDYLNVDDHSDDDSLHKIGDILIEKREKMVEAKNGKNGYQNVANDTDYDSPFDVDDQKYHDLGIGVHRNHGLIMNKPYSNSLYNNGKISASNTNTNLMGNNGARNTMSAIKNGASSTTGTSLQVAGTVSGQYYPSTMSRRSRIDDDREIEMQMITTTNSKNQFIINKPPSSFSTNQRPTPQQSYEPDDEDSKLPQLPNNKISSSRTTYTTRTGGFSGRRKLMTSNNGDIVFNDNILLKRPQQYNDNNKNMNQNEEEQDDDEEILNVFKDMHKTKEYLGEPLGKEFEDEFKKNIVDIVNEHQEELRNEAIKPVMLEVVDNMFEDMEDGNGAQKFLRAIQLLSANSNKGDEEEEEDDNGDKKEDEEEISYDENYEPDAIHQQLSDENRKLQKDLNINPDGVKNIDGPRDINYELAQSGQSVGADSVAMIELKSAKNAMGKMIMNESVEIEKVDTMVINEEREWEIKEDDNETVRNNSNTNGDSNQNNDSEKVMSVTSIKSISDVISDSGNEAGMVYMNNDAMNESIELSAQRIHGMNHNQMIEQYVDEKIDTAQSVQKEPIQIFSQAVNGPTTQEFNDDNNDFPRNFVTRKSDRNKQDSEILYPFESVKDPNVFERENRLDSDMKNDKAFIENFITNTDSLETIHDVDSNNNGNDIGNNNGNNNYNENNDNDQNQNEEQIKHMIYGQDNNSNTDFMSSPPDSPYNGSKSGSSSGSDGIFAVHPLDDEDDDEEEKEEKSSKSNKVQAGAEENSIEIYGNNSSNNNDDNNDNMMDDSSQSSSAANTEIINDSSNGGSGNRGGHKYRITITTPMNDDTNPYHTFQYSPDSHNINNGSIGPDVLGNGHNVQQSDSMELAD